MTGVQTCALPISSLGVTSPSAVYYGQRNLEWVWLKNTPASLLWRTAPAHAIYSLAGLVHYACSGRGWSALRGKRIIQHKPDQLLEDVRRADPEGEHVLGLDIDETGDGWTMRWSMWAAQRKIRADDAKPPGLLSSLDADVYAGSAVFLEEQTDRPYRLVGDGM